MLPRACWRTWGDDHCNSTTCWKASIRFSFDVLFRKWCNNTPSKVAKVKRLYIWISWLRQDLVLCGSLFLKEWNCLVVSFGTIDEPLQFVSDSSPSLVVPDLSITAPPALTQSRRIPNIYQWICNYDKRTNLNGKYPLVCVNLKFLQFSGNEGQQMFEKVKIYSIFSEKIFPFYSFCLFF